MKARLIKNDSGTFEILYSDGTISNCSEYKAFEFLRKFKDCDRFCGNDGKWYTESTPDMSMYPGITCAMITDDCNLVVLDVSPFIEVLDQTFSVANYISTEQYGALHNRSPEIVKAYCRKGRIPGAKRIGTTWIIPEDAPYPIAPRYRRDDLALSKRKKKKEEEG